MLGRARGLAAQGEDDAAKRAYLGLLRLDPAHRLALIELGALAQASGHRSAAKTAYLEAVRCHPEDPIARAGLGQQCFEEGDLPEARRQYQAALAAKADFPEAHQGLARVFAALGDEAAAAAHWRNGFARHAVSTRAYRGAGPGVAVLLLVAAKGGNIPVQHWIDDRRLTVIPVYADFHDPTQALPPHALIFNAIGDADLCGKALARAGRIVRRGTAPVINPPARVRATDRVNTARRLGGIAGVVAPPVVKLSKAKVLNADVLQAKGLGFPLLLRTPGFHTGQHFIRVATRDGLAAALALLPGDDVLVIPYLDARGPDGMARKYRVMFIDGALYPLHLAISRDWKVHYFTGAMAEHAAYREEERRFLADMPGVLGARAMAALRVINRILGLDYAGIDFGLAPDGSLLFFEANATMVVSQPEADPIWDYRRQPVAAVLKARERLLWDRIGDTLVGAEGLEPSTR